MLRGLCGLAALASVQGTSDWPLPIAQAKGFWQTVGNHRFAISVPPSSLEAKSTLVNANDKAERNPKQSSSVVTVQIPWLRLDSLPLTGGPLIRSGDDPVTTCQMYEDESDRDSAVFSFSADQGAGTYYLYYLPFRTCEYRGGSCQYGQGAHQVYYDVTPHCALVSEPAPPLSNVTVVLQSKEELDSNKPMQVRMSKVEEAAFVKAHIDPSSGVLLVAEGRADPIRMTRHLPSKWLDRDQLLVWEEAVRPGENFTFQVGLFAASTDVAVTAVSFLNSKDRSTQDHMEREERNGFIVDARCMNMQGTDFWGQDTEYGPVDVPVGSVMPLWMAMELRPDTPPGVYELQLVIDLATDNTPPNAVSTPVVLRLNVSGAAVERGGDDELTRGTRLQWLDSRYGLGPQGVPAPFTAIKVDPSLRTVDMLGKHIRLGPNGLPAAITTTLPSTTSKATTTDVLARAVGFSLSNCTMDSTSWALEFGTPTEVAVSWVASGDTVCLGANVTVEVRGSVDCTGYLDYSVAMRTRGEGDIWLSAGLDVSANPAFLFAMGFGRHGGLLSGLATADAPLDWKWDGVNGNNGAWIGSSSGGIRVYLKGEDPMWQAGVPFDGIKSPVAPVEWDNHGQGGARLASNGSVTAWTGAQLLHKDLTLRFSLLVTPTRPLNLTRHWSQRWVQIGMDYASETNYTYLHEQGATVLNVHQGHPMNPWINYPYLTNDAMKDAADACHKLGMKFSIYNTMRELSNRCMEIYAMLAFNETFVPGKQGGTDWLQEHLSAFSYSPAWSTPVDTYSMDAAIRTTALSRWNNYYAKGMQRMKQDFDLDGIYLDEIAYDRLTLLRARVALGEGGVVDHHSDSGQFCVSPAMNYMELFPFIDRLWYGEGFNYTLATADYWLVELSGIPFGLTADMLRYSGMTAFPFKGFVFGSSNRWQGALSPGQTDPFSPLGLWALWNQFGIDQSQMFGWWLELEASSSSPVTLPVSTDTVPQAEVKVTSYVIAGARTLIAVASFSALPLACTLVFDWSQLGLQVSTARLSLPHIPGMQDGEDKVPLDRLWTVPPNQGFVLWLN